MFKKKLSEWLMLPAEVEVTHFYGNMEHPAQETHVQGADGEVSC